ncbi:MAG: restriction endonuclease subunit S [Paludibacter sp.]|nr:restriction endonuclease subunit S [Paludibacter sp.]
MIRYDKYKPSGVEWLGEIPEHWEVKRVKDFGEYQSGYFIDANEFDNNNDYPVFGGNGIRSYASKHNHNGEYILIGRQGALCGNINIAKGKFWATEHAVVVYNKSNINKKWYAFLLEVMNLNQYAISAAQPGLSVDKVKRLMLPYISLPEQIAIANYLDTKTVAIDQKIELLTAKTAKYNALRRSLINETVCRGLNPNVPLKDSGIEWIGKIPAHWEVKRFKEIARTVKGKNLDLSDTYFDKSLPNLSLDFLRNDSITFDTFCYTTDKNQRVTTNDMIIIWDGAGVGEILKGKDGFLSSTIAKIVVDNKKYDKNFLYHLRFSIEYVLKMIPAGMGIPHLNPQVLNSFDCPCPPLIEQLEIAQYLDNQTSQIDTILSNISNQIGKLTQLRKTLINDVVTGKIKVTED